MGGERGVTTLIGQVDQSAAGHHVGADAAANRTGRAFDLLCRGLRAWCQLRPRCGVEAARDTFGKIVAAQQAELRPHELRVAHYLRFAVLAVLVGADVHFLQRKFDLCGRAVALLGQHRRHDADDHRRTDDGGDQPAPLAEDPQRFTRPDLALPVGCRFGDAEQIRLRETLHIARLVARRHDLVGFLVHQLSSPKKIAHARTAHFRIRTDGTASPAATSARCSSSPPSWTIRPPR